jgi:hypothetical protein
VLRTRTATTTAHGVREALRLLVQREVFRWLLVELSDLLLDAFLGFVALYFVDEVGTAASTGLAVAVWTGAGLVGSAAMIPLLRRVDGLAYLRVSSAAPGLLFVAFCSCPDGLMLVLVATIAVVNAGWYPVLQTRLYDALSPASGLAPTVGGLFPVERAAPARAARVRPRVQPAASSVTPSVSRQRAKRPLKNIGRNQRQTSARGRRGR